MRSYFATLRQLVLPAGSPPDSPAVVIGDDMPPAVTQFYAATGRQIIAGIVMRQNANTLVYDALITFGGAPSRVIGTLTSAGGVVEVMRVATTGAVTLEGAYTFSVGPVNIDTGVTFQPSGPSRFVGPVTYFQDAAWSGGKSLPRGLVAYIDSDVNTATITGAAGEVVTLTLPSTALAANRAFETRVWGHYQTTVATVAGAVVRVRLGNVAGGVVMDQFIAPVPQSTYYRSQLNAGKFRTGPNGLTTGFVTTLQATDDVTGTASPSSRLRTFEIWDVGAAADFPTVPAI